MKLGAFVSTVLVLSLVGTGEAKGGSIAYNLVDYAALQTGAIGSVDEISGQITTDGATGTFSGGFASHITTASLTFTDAGETYFVPDAAPVLSPFPSTRVKATPSTLSLLGSDCFSLFGFTSQHDLVNVTWVNDMAHRGKAHPYFIIDLTKGDFTRQFTTWQFTTVTSPWVSGGVDTNNTWVFATDSISPAVPDPSIPLGICTSLLGLCAVFMCERKRSARRLRLG